MNEGRSISTAKVINSKIGANVRVYDFAEIRNSEIGDNVIIGNYAIVVDSNVESNISINRSNYIFRSIIGKFSYTGIGTSIRSAQVGSFCSLAWNVSIGGGNHEFKNITTSPLWRFNMLDRGVIDRSKDGELAKRHNEFGECSIGNDVWIGTNAVILRGVHIGNGAIVGAGAVVTRNVEPYSVVVGAPAKPIRKRFSEEIIRELVDLKWWNWPLDVIRENSNLVFSQRVNAKVIDRMKRVQDSINPS